MLEPITGRLEVLVVDRVERLTDDRAGGSGTSSPIVRADWAQTAAEFSLRRMFVAERTACSERFARWTW
jgi:hypothetical protein